MQEQHVTRREHAIRGAFSFLAAASFAYVAAENWDYAIQRRRYDRIFVAGACAALAVWEAGKVGRRLDGVLGLAA